MIDTIKLGLKDVIYNIKTLFILILAILAITVIFVSSTLSIFYADSSDYDKRLFQGYQLVPTSTDMSKNKQLLKDYTNFINENGASYIISQKLSDQYGIATMIAIGDGSLICDQFSQENVNFGYFVAGGNDPLNEVVYRGKKIKLTTIEIKYNDMLREIIIEEPFIIICLSHDDNLIDWLNYKDGGELLELFSNSIFEKEISHYEKSLLNFFDNSFISLAKIDSSNNEKSFIFSYIYPFVFIAALCVFISFWLFYSHYLKKMYREYIIHMLYGAQKKDILLRNSIVMFFILIVTFLMFFMIKQNETSMIANTGYLFITIFVLILELITIIKINLDDKLKSMKGIK